MFDSVKRERSLLSEIYIKKIDNAFSSAIKPDRESISDITEAK